MDRYQLFGLQRSGTNYLQQLLEQNFRVQGLNTHKDVWKHNVTIPQKYNASYPSILIVKHPYTWVESLCERNPVDWLKRQKKFPASLDEKGMTFGKNRFNVRQLAKTYAYFFSTWFSEVDFIIRYEDLLFKDRREKILSQLQEKYNWKRKESYWVNPGRIYQSGDYNMGREKYYKAMKPMNLNEFQIKAINDELENEMRVLSFPIIPAD